MLSTSDTGNDMAEYVIGVDVHKRSHTFVAVDSAGRKMSSHTSSTTTAGHSAALQWARTTCNGSRLWGIEDLRNLSSRLESDLLAAGESVVRVPPNLTARQRASARSWGKSDPIDALAVARAVLRYGHDLPIAAHDPYSREIKLLVDRRDDLVITRTATINRLLDRLHELDPERSSKLRLKLVTHRAAAASLLKPHHGVLANLAHAELTEVADLSIKINSLEKHLKNLVTANAPSLISTNGCGPLMAAKIIGETAGITRFSTESKYAQYCGVAPVPNWSGSTMGRVKTAKTGNRQINSALHTIAVVQIRKGGRGEQYYRRRVNEGDSHAKALRRVKRQVCRAVYYCQMADTRNRTPQTSPEAPSSST
jgi:transposase